VTNLKDLIPVEDHETAISLFKSARWKLNPEGGEFVCCNLSESAFLYDEKRIVEILRNEIRERLEGHTTVCAWLFEKCGIGHDVLFSRSGWRLVEYRQRWIDSMIQELQ
jgi:hypothetical protein